MKKVKSQKTEVLDKEREEFKGEDSRTKILIIDGSLSIRKEIIQIVKQKSETFICAEANNFYEGLESAEKNKADLAIINILPEGPSTIRFVEKLKFQCPHISILMLSIEDKALAVEPEKQEQQKGFFIGQQGSDQIIKAIGHIESLLRCGFCGLHVLVKI
ncbi:MAG: response regulator transcription factor [Planctomycetota bacterium]